MKYLKIDCWSGKYVYCIRFRTCIVLSIYNLVIPSKKTTYIHIAMVIFYIPLRCWLELFMFYGEYMSTEENLHFLFEVCK